MERGGVARAARLDWKTRPNASSGDSNDRGSPPRAWDRVAMSRVALTAASPRVTPDVSCFSRDESPPLEHPGGGPETALSSNIGRLLSYGRIARFIASAVNESANASNALFASKVTSGAPWPSPPPRPKATPGGGRAIVPIAVTQSHPRRPIKISQQNFVPKKLLV